MWHQKQNFCHALVVEERKRLGCSFRQEMLHEKFVFLGRGTFTIQTVVFWRTVAELMPHCSQSERF